MDEIEYYGASVKTMEEFLIRYVGDGKVFPTIDELVTSLLVLDAKNPNKKLSQQATKRAEWFSAKKG